PNDETGWNLLAWTGASSVSADKRTATIALDSVNDVTVSAKLDGTEKTTTIEVYDLVTLTSPLPSGKAYASNDAMRLTVVTNPDEAKVWQHLVFSEGAPTVDKNECDVDLDPVGARTVSVTLGDKTLDMDLDIHQWPTLQIKEIEFECHTVLNDGVAEIGQKF